MQTILGAGGQIAEELARELHKNFTRDIRLVSRNPQRVNDSDELVSADLMDASAASAAVSGGEIIYLTVGLPLDSALWEQRFPTMMANVIAACRQHGAKLVFFDNTYMYPRTAAPQTESTAFEPSGRKSAVRARIATMLQQEIDAGRIEAVICRAPEFYGPGKTQSLTNSAVFNRIKQGKRALVPVSMRTQRSLIWTPDASRAMALIGNTPDAYGQTWHLPVDPSRPTYRSMLEISSQAMGAKVRSLTVPGWLFKLGGKLNSALKESSELLPRYHHDNIFDSSKFTERFPDFEVTSIRDGIGRILAE